MKKDARPPFPSGFLCGAQREKAAPAASAARPPSLVISQDPLPRVGTAQRSGSPAAGSLRRASPPPLRRKPMRKASHPHRRPGVRDSSVPRCACRSAEHPLRPAAALPRSIFRFAVGRWFWRQSATVPHGRGCKAPVICQSNPLHLSFSSQGSRESALGTGQTYHNIFSGSRYIFASERTSFLSPLPAACREGCRFFRYKKSTRRWLETIRRMLLFVQDGAAGEGSASAPWKKACASKGSPSSGGRTG